jgi:hypothetical protein
VTNEKAPEPAATGLEGQNPEGNINMNIIPETDAVREAVAEWARAFTPDGDLPAWPAVAVPSWADAEPEVGLNMGGEVVVTFERSYGAVVLSALVSVVVDDSTQFDHNHPGGRIGDVADGDGGAITLTIVGGHENLDVSAASALFDSLAEAVAMLRRIEDERKVVQR